MRALDDERRAVARAFGHELPSVDRGDAGDRDGRGVGPRRRRFRRGDLVGRSQSQDQGAGFAAAPLLSARISATASCRSPRLPASPGSTCRLPRRFCGSARVSLGSILRPRAAPRSAWALQGLDRNGLLKLVGGTHGVSVRRSTGRKLDDRNARRRQARAGDRAPRGRNRRTGARPRFPVARAGHSGRAST